MEELFEMIFKVSKKMEKEEKNFVFAEELGIRRGDLIIWKDGSINYIDKPNKEKVRFKAIAEVRRPTRWVSVDIIKPKRKRKTTKKGDK